MCYSIDCSLVLLGAELVLTGLYTLYIPVAGPLSRQIKDLKQIPSRIPLNFKNFQFRSNNLLGDFVLEGCD